MTPAISKTPYDLTKFGFILFGLDDKKILEEKKFIQSLYNKKNYTIQYFDVENNDQFQQFLQNLVAQDLFHKKTIYCTTLPEKNFQAFLSFIDQYKSTLSSLINPFILIQGNLKKQSLLRKYPNSSIQYIALYPDNLQERERYIQNFFTNHQQQIDSQTLRYLIYSLREDRSTTSNTLEILSLYTYPSKNISLQQIEKLHLSKDFQNIEKLTLDLLLGRILSFSNKNPNLNTISLIRGIKNTILKIMLLKNYTSEHQQQLGFKKLFIFFYNQQDYKKIINFHNYISLHEILTTCNLIETKIFFQKLKEDIGKNILFFICMKQYLKQNK